MLDRKTTLFESTIKSLPLVGRGKVRDIYSVDRDRLLLLATDRLSAFDVIMNQPIPGKGEILTKLSLFWFSQLSHIVPNHLTSENPEDVVLECEKEQVRNRSMLVKRLTPIPIEAVVRGYLAGSAWTEYKTSGEVCGIRLPHGIPIAAKLQSPIFTPATKAPSGGHDQNINKAQAENLIGIDAFSRIQKISVQLYETAANLALRKGIIIADTKFEFGIDKSGTLTLMDEILTPDSSRFWPQESYTEGVNPPSFDKQFVRDWLEKATLDGKRWNKTAPAPSLPSEVIEATSAKYRDAMNRIIEWPN